MTLAGHTPDTATTACDAAAAFPMHPDVHYWITPPPYTSAVGYTRTHIPLVEAPALAPAVAAHAAIALGRGPIYVRRPRQGWWSLQVAADGQLTLERLDGHASVRDRGTLLA